MSLDDQSPETLALDAAVEANRRGEAGGPVADQDLSAYVASGGAAAVSVVRLTPRNPWIDGVAAMYAFHASRWDTPANLVFCFPNQQPPGAGWDGTVLYVDFIPPAAGSYTIAAAFHGPNSIVHLRGPWGIINQSMPAGQDMDVVVAHWSGGNDLFFTLTFSGSWIGQISAVQIFEGS